MGAQDTYPLSETVMDMARVLGGLSRRVTTETDERNALQRCLERVCVSLDVEGAFIGLLAASDRVAIAHEHRTDRRLPSLLGSQIGLQSGMREASDLPTRCCASDAGEVACWGAVAPRTTGSCLHVVLGYAGRPFGVLAVQAFGRRRDWEPREVTFLRTVGDQFGMWLWLRRLSAATRQTLEALSGHMAPLQDLVGVTGGGKIARSSLPPEDQLDGRFASLTRRERQVLLRLDRPNKAIAHDLYLSESTVKAHVGRILAKLGVDRAQALALLRQGVPGESS